MIDSHCHPFDLEPGPFDLNRMAIDLSHAGEASEPIPHLWHSVLLTRLAARLGVNDDDVVEARDAAVEDYGSYVAGLFADAGITDLVMDVSWPPGSAEGVADFAKLSGCRVHPLLRLESVIDPLIEQGTPFADLLDAFDATLAGASGAGYRGLKSAIAYRTGLAVAPDVSAEAARASLAEEAPLRRRAKPLRDFLVHRALGSAADHGLPVQFHTGFGDSDLRLADSNPLHLQELLDSPVGSAASIVLLHSGYPFQGEAAFLAAAHPHVFVDISLIPLFAPASLVETFVRILGLAPPSRVLAGTDAYALPELFWLAAHMLREAWDQASYLLRNLGGSTAWVDTARDAVMTGNAARLYQLDSLDAGPH